MLWKEQIQMKDTEIRVRFQGDRGKDSSVCVSAL